MVSVLPCKRGRFLDASPLDCAFISGPYEKDSPPSISCLISVPSFRRGETVAVPRDRCLLRAPQYLKLQVQKPEQLLWCLTLLGSVVGVKWGS